MTSNIFEQAVKAKLRFPTPVGDVTCEQVWDLPLTAKGSSTNDLDHLAREISKELKATVEDSFVRSETNPNKNLLELRLEIVKHIISHKIGMRERAEKAAATSGYKQKLLQALEAKAEANLANLSVEQLRAELAKLT